MQNPTKAYYRIVSFFSGIKSVNKFMMYKKFNIDFFSNCRLIYTFGNDSIARL